MFGSQDTGADPDQFKLLEELQLNQPQDLARGAVAGGARELRSPLSVVTGNASGRAAVPAKGQSLRLEPASVTATLDRALLPGDLFQVEFEEASLGIGKPFAQCRRCRMLTEGSYEVLLQFLSPVRLS